MITPTNRNRPAPRRSMRVVGGSATKESAREKAETALHAATSTGRARPDLRIQPATDRHDWLMPLDLA